jgi:hypothetical protein
MKTFDMSYVVRPDYMMSVPSFEEYLEKFNIQDFSYQKDKIISKWTPVVKSQFNDFIIDEDTTKSMCIFFELCFNYNQLVSDFISSPKYLSSLFESLRNKIKLKNQDRRSTVLRKVFNYQTGTLEYELEDGNFIPINESVIPPKIEVDSDIFPIEFIKLIDPQKYRDKKIDQIL